MSLDPRLLALLACPACRAKLDEKDAALVCSGCGKSYPVVDGIPKLLN